jgi:hypothetical protein
MRDEVLIFSSVSQPVALQQVRCLLVFLISWSRLSQHSGGVSPTLTTLFIIFFSSTNLARLPAICKW